MLRKGDSFKFWHRDEIVPAQVLDVLPWSERPLKVEYVDHLGKHIEQFNTIELGEYQRQERGAMPSILH